MSSLLTWAERVIGTVEQDGRTSVRIRLTAEGSQWESWEIRPGLTAQEWVTEAETLQAALAEEFPVRRVSLIYTAEDPSGAVFSQFPRSITGRNKNAAELGSASHVKPVTDGVASLVTTMEKILEVGRKQLDQMQKVVEDRDEEVRQLHELFRGLRQIELEAGEQSNALKDAMVEQLKEAGPMAKMLLEFVLDKAKKQSQAIPAAAQAAANTVSNGKAAS